MKFATVVRLGIAAFTLLAGVCQAQASALDAALNEQIVMVPVGSGLFGVELETTIFKPAGAGPFPLLVMNHGKAHGDPRFQERARYLVISREFVKRGYAVLIPMRKGFSKSTGSYIDGGCNLAGNGQAQADDLQSALEFALKQPWADPNRILVAGQSHGGLTAMAFGARNASGVRGLINFAGGLRKDDQRCQWQFALADAFADFGAKTTAPSLWFYGANDSYFNPEVAARMYAAYTKAGGAAKLIAYGPFKNDSHGMSSSRDGVKIWWPETERFLKLIGLPTEIVFPIMAADAIPKTDFAAIENVAAIPHLKESGREGYRVFLDKATPRAFAVSATGAWGWANDGDDPTARALANCQKHSKQDCRLYAIDDYVVWKE